MAEEQVQETPLETVLKEIHEAGDMEKTLEWAPGDPFGRLDAIVYHSPTLGRTIRERRNYKPVYNVAGGQVGWALQSITLEEVV